ncbi:MAG: DUF6754 domain-containing protein [Candidatus Rifleibacteriota bacterium]
MSVTWQPSRMFLPFMVLILSLVSSIPLAAQVQNAPVTAIQPTEAEDENTSRAPQAAMDSSLPGVENTSEQTQSKDASVAQTAEVSGSVGTEVSEGNESSPDAVAPTSAAAAKVKSAKGVTVKQPATNIPGAKQVDEKKAPVVKHWLYKYLDVDRLNVLIIIIFLLGFVSYFTFHAQRGKELFIRRISGLSALEDAVGRATEMGRGVLYIPGIMDMDDIQTIAGVTILGQVAKKTAEYDTPLYAPMTRSFVMSVAQEIVKQAYLEKGRPDAYRPDRINYLTDDQFGYVAGVSGIMMRDKPAACFYLGTFYAESLILAETGNSVGAIQIAGTAEPSQIPFFVAACDYTLIGEELFAASAYLSRNPKEVGSLKGQDVSKIIIISFIIIGTVLISVAQTDIGVEYGINQLADNYMKLFK